MARAAHIADMPTRAEGQIDPNPNIWRHTYNVFVLDTAVGQQIYDFTVDIDIVSDTAQQIEVKRRDAFIAQAPLMNPLFTNWLGSDVYQCQLRRN
jgi:hypothetical protein